ncbi:hypothetical protein [Klebsiella michiganensis]
MEKKSLRKIKKWIIAAAIFTQTLGSAYGNLNFQAGAMEDGTFLLTVNGSISSGDAYIFAKQIDSFKQDNMPLSQIWLNSLGGNVADALKMSLIISSNNLTTVVPNRWECVSACVLLFGAGIRRHAFPESIIGVHRISINEIDNDQARSLSLDMDTVYTAMNFPENIKYKMLTTPPNDVYYLTTIDKKNISTTYSNTKQVDTSYRNSGISAPRVIITKKDRSESRALNQKAIIQIRSNQFISAIANLETAKKIYPSDAEVLGNLGYAYYMIGDYTAAQMNLTSSLKLAPRRGSSWNNLGLVLASTNQIEWAVNCFINYWNFSKNKKAATNQFLSWEQERPGTGIDIASKRARSTLGIYSPE